jgi:hypothetical protein
MIIQRDKTGKGYRATQGDISIYGYSMGNAIEKLVAIIRSVKAWTK